jgi:RNA polymerase sigma-70 factor (ECF subfamily)
MVVNKSPVRTAYSQDRGFSTLADSMDENQKREEFARVWLKSEPSVSAYVFASITGFHDAEDVVQQVAQTLARRFDEYDADRPFVGWALWIAKSRVIDFYRRQERNQIVFSDRLLERLAETIAEQAESHSRRREALETCLGEMPEKSRKLLDLRYVDGLSAADVAQAMGSTGGSVRVLLTRIRSALSDCIERRISSESAS